jgi:hypothetical protein
MPTLLHWRRTRTVVAQQVIQYVLYGLAGNYMNEQVFTPRDVYPAEDVKLHLGLTGDNARKCFMEL